jgi:hypothetical protein
MHTAMFAKGVLRHLGVELIRGQIVLAAEQFELLRRDNQVQKAFLAAHRTVAIGHAVKIAGDAETNAPAMTTAFENS